MLSNYHLNFNSRIYFLNSILNKIKNNIVWRKEKIETRNKNEKEKNWKSFANSNEQLPIAFCDLIFASNNNEQKSTFAIQIVINFSVALMKNKL